MGCLSDNDDYGPPREVSPASMLARSDNDDTLIYMWHTLTDTEKKQVIRTKQELGIRLKPWEQKYFDVFETYRKYLEQGGENGPTRFP